jgi:branched-chain amino acid transport system permease protein
MCAPTLLPRYGVDLITQGMIFAIVGMGLDVLVGYAGMPSLGHAAFFGLASYGLAIAVTRWGWAAWAGAGMGILAGVGAAALFGVLAIRCRGVYFLVSTLAFGQVLWGGAVKWTDFSGGYNGIPGVPRPSFFAWALWEPSAFYFFTCGVCVVVASALLVFVTSPVGKILAGIRESESRMRVLGYRTQRYRYMAFCVSAFITSIAGVLMAYFNGFVGPDSLHWSLSAQTLLMVVLGGPGTLLGPAGAGVLLVVAQNVVSNFTERWTLVLGLLYVATMLFAPRGVVSLLYGRPFYRRATP